MPVRLDRVSSNGGPHSGAAVVKGVVGVPLSDREQHLFEQIEQSLAAEDPRFGSSGRSRRAASAGLRRALGVIAVLVGLGCAVLAVAVGSGWWGPFVGTVGFVLIVAGLWAAIRSRPAGGHDSRR